MLDLPHTSRAIRVSCARPGCRLPRARAIYLRVFPDRADGKAAAVAGGGVIKETWLENTNPDAARRKRGNQVKDDGGGEY